MRAQGLPINLIILVALALLVLVVVGAFFISGFGEASGGVNVAGVNQADCQALCQNMVATAFNYDDCETFKQYEGSVRYLDECASSFGACTVTLKGGVTCMVSI